MGIIDKSKKVQFIAAIPQSRGAISIGGGEDEPIDLKLQIFNNDMSDTLVRELVDQRGERLFVTIERYDPKKHRPE